MKILFVNPPNTTAIHKISDGFEYVEKNIGNEFFIMPRIPFEITGILSANQIESELLLLDVEWFQNPEFRKDELIKLIIDKKPDIILTTLIAQASTDTIDWLSTNIKKNLPDTIIVVGGQAITYLKELIFDYCPSIDYALIGDASQSLPNLIKKIVSENIDISEKTLINPSNQSYSDAVNLTPDLMYKKNKSIITNLVKTCKEKNMYVLGLLELTRGCPYNCSFCAAKRKYVENNYGAVYNELNYLFDLGIHKYYFIDLTFGVNSIKTSQFLQRLSNFKKQNSLFGFRCVTRLNLVRKELVANLENAGCYEVGVGVETYDDAILKKMNKHSSEKKTIDSLDILGMSNIRTKLFLIEGYPGSTTESSRKTFELLNYLESKSYDYFVQPALSRDIIPSLPGFEERHITGIIKRQTLQQLDFRHDGRIYGWDSDKDLRSVCLLMLAYPSTELGKKRRDLKLQKRISLEMPFLTNNRNFPQALDLVLGLPSEEENNELVKSIRADILHYIEGIYTLDEIKKKLLKLYQNEQLIEKELENCIKVLSENNLINSFKKQYGGNKTFSLIRIKSKYPSRSQYILFFYDGDDKRYIYAPLDSFSNKIKNCFYENFPLEVFEFLTFLKGAYSIKEISEKLYFLFRGKTGFKNRVDSKKTTVEIFQTCKRYGLCA